MNYVLNKSKAGAGAQDFLKESFNNNAKKFSDIEKKLKKEENDLLSKKAEMNKEEYINKTDELRKKVIDYQSQRRSSLDKLAKQRADAKTKLFEKINPILTKYVQENNISIVIDKKDVISSNTEFDITKIIVEKLDKELPSLNLK